MIFARSYFLVISVGFVDVSVHEIIMLNKHIFIVAFTGKGKRIDSE